MLEHWLRPPNRSEVFSGSRVRFLELIMKMKLGKTVKFNISCVTHVVLLVELRANTMDTQDVLIFMALLF